MTIIYDDNTKTIIDDANKTIIANDKSYFVHFTSLMIISHTLGCNNVVYVLIKLKKKLFRQVGIYSTFILTILCGVFNLTICSMWRF